MIRFLSAAAAFAALFAGTAAHAAADSPDCSPAVLAALGRELKAAHFVPGPRAAGRDQAGVVIESRCKPLPDDPRLTLAAVGWDAHKDDSKALAIAIVDESASAVVALRQDEVDEDATTRLNALRLDTAPYALAPGVRAFGVDVYSDNPGCGGGGVGPRRTLYVREGRTLRPVLEDVAIGEYRYLKGDQPRCIEPGESQETITEDHDVTIGLGAPGKSSWRDLLLTVTARRSDHQPARKPLHVRVPYDGNSYDLAAFNKAYVAWNK